MGSLRALCIAAFVCSYALPAGAGEPVGYLYLLRTTQLFPLTGEETTLGRLTENDIVLTSPRVSRRHAMVRAGEEGVQVVDVGSSNGTELNGEPLRPRLPTTLRAGDRLTLADETFLYHASLEELWHDELRHRLLASFVKLRLHLPQDRALKAFGREETVAAVTRARLNAETGAMEVEHSVPLDPKSGLPEGAAAFVGHVEAKSGVLELSLWALAAGESMTSRRASYTTLKHATLEIAIAGGDSGGANGPWYPPNVISSLFEVFPDDEQLSLQLASSLAIQENPRALRDAAASLAFRHRLDPGEWKLLVLAAQSKGLWVEGEIGAKGLSLGGEEKKLLEAALQEARTWLERARELGAGGKPGEEAETALIRAGERLSRLQNSP